MDTFAPAQVVQLPPSTPEVVGLPTVSYQDLYAEICSEIIRMQSDIMGSYLAQQQAATVKGLTVDSTTLRCVITGDGALIIDELVNAYSNFFGEAALEVCRDAAARFVVQLRPEQVPAALLPT